MIIGHFTPTYTPICPGQVAQILREESVLHDRLGYDYRWWSEERSSIVSVRNSALRDAISMGCDYLLMQDSDVWSKSSMGAVAPMLATARETGAAAVAAIVGLRRKKAAANVLPCRPGEVYAAEKAGTGMILIDCAQAEEVGAPWFANTYSNDGCEIEVGEDIHFCRLLRKHGKALYVDGRIPTTHVRRDVWTLDYPGRTASVGSQNTDGTHPQ